MATLWQDFRLGLAGLLDYAVGGTRAADIWAAQEAERQGMTPENAASLLASARELETSQDLPGQAARMTASQIGSVVSNAFTSVLLLAGALLALAIVVRARK
jgi:hypothetical protein